MLFFRGVLVSCSLWASAASESFMTRSICGRKLAAGQPAIDLGGRLALLLGGGVEHGKAVDPGVAGVERPDRQRGLGVAAGHDDDPPAEGQVADGPLEIRFAEVLPPDVDFAETARARLRHCPSCSSPPALAPSLRQIWTFSSLPAVVMTRAPMARAICTTHDPTPPEPPCTKTFSPIFSWASRKRPRWAVIPTRAMAAASSNDTSSGMRIEPLLFDGRELGESALAAQQALVAAPDAVPRLQPLDVRANRVDNAGQIATEDERLGQFHGDGAGTNVRVDGIDRHGLDLDKHLRARRLWLRQIAVDDLIDRPGFFNVRSFHGPFPP